MSVIVKEACHFDREKPTVTETRLIQASDPQVVFDECRAFVGGMQVIGGILTFVPPAVHPSTGLICLSGDFSFDWQSDANPSTFKAELVLTYGVPESQDDGATDIGSISLDLGGSMIQLAKGNYRWTEGANSGNTLGDNDLHPFKTDPSATVSVKFNTRETLNVAALFPLYGKINSASWYLDSIQQSVAAECARFEGVKSTRKYTTDGYQYFEVDYTFSIASHSWNKVFDGDIYALIEDQNGNPLYSTYNFSGIFNL
jgi:hypothetical protein